MKLKIIFAFIIGVVFACGGSGEKSDAAGIAARAAGKKVFKAYCVACHGANGKLGINGAKDYAQSDLTLEERIEVITNGRGMMNAFSGMLSEAQIKAAAEYTIHLGNQKEEE